MMGNDFPEKPTRTRRKTTYKGAAAKKTSGLVPRTDKQGELIQALQDSSHCLLYTSPSPRDGLLSRMPSSA